MLSASYPARITVTIPARATFEPCGDLAPEINGPGLAPTVVMFRDEAGASNRPLSFFRPPGYPPGYTMTAHIGNSGCDLEVLVAGRYRIYLIPDGGRVTVKFYLTGLRGRVSLSLRRHLDYGSMTPAPSFESPGSGVFWAGGSATLRSKGFFLGIVWAEAVADGVSHLSVCVNDTPFLSEPVSHSPACVLGDGFAGIGDWVNGPGIAFEAVSGTRLAGTYEISGHIVSSNVYRNPGMHAFWLSYD